MAFETAQHGTESTEGRPVRVVLGRGVANHPGLLDAVREAALARSVIVAVHHTHEPSDAVSRPDAFLREPVSSTPESYVSSCITACREWGADLFWPGRELARLAARAGEFAQIGTLPMLAASSPVIDLLDDKEAFARVVRQLGMPAPRSLRFHDLEGFDLAYQDIAGTGERVCFKPVRGVFGRGFRVVREDLDPFEDLLEDPGYRLDLEDARRRFGSRAWFRPFVAMPWLDGHEWSVDCFRSAGGDAFVGIPRRKLNATAQALEDAQDLIAMSRTLAQHFGLAGLFNVQFKAHRGVPHVLEINPRPAGGMGLSRHAGVELVELALRDALGLPLRTTSPRLGRTLRSVTRWEELELARLETLPSPSRDGSTLTADLPAGRLEVCRTSGTWYLPALLDIAARRNAARSYLLVSRVLGKHLPVTPSRMLQAHEALAEQLPTDLPGPVLFVGMAETATGLGWGVQEAWCARSGRADALYLHTTRYPVAGHRALPFEERHSHGPSQVLCPPLAGEAADAWRQARTLVVVDDEVTTGCTASALAAALSSDGVPCSRRVIVSLVTSDDATQPGGALHTWDAIQLATVRVEFSGKGTPPVATSPQGLTALDPGRGSRGWGRTGAMRAPPLPPALLARVLGACSGASTVHVIGAGESMHPAFVLGRALEATGLLVMVQASTRSPVLAFGAIPASLDAADGLGSGVPFFLHNPPIRAVRVLALHEPGATDSVASLVHTCGALPIEVWDA